MNEESQVKVEFDNGHRSRWATGSFIYRADGKKSTLHTKRILIAVGLFFGVSTSLILMTGPKRIVFRSPIVLSNATSNGADVEVPAAASGRVNAKSQTKTSKAIGRGPKRLSAMEVVSRPRFGQIPPGTVVRARLASGGSNGLVKAELLDDLEIQGDGIAETGTSLIGTGSSTEERLMVNFSKMVFKNGEQQTIHAQACDGGDQSIGLKGSKVGRAASMLAAGIGLNFAGGLADGLQESDVRSGVSVRKSDLKNAALNGSAKASIEESKSVMEKWKAQKTVIEVKVGTEICIIFSDNS